MIDDDDLTRARINVGTGAMSLADALDSEFVEEACEAVNRVRALVEALESRNVDPAIANAWTASLIWFAVMKDR